MSDQTKVAIITGGSRGIGAAIAETMAQAGFDVLINYVSNQAQAESVRQAVTASGRRAVIFQGNVAVPAEVSAMFDYAEQSLGKVHTVINSAGMLKTLPLLEHSDELFARTFAINTQGSFNVMREAGKRLIDGGRIIMLSTTAIRMKMPGYAIYNASKAAVEALVATFAKELRGRAITVNAVAPGPVATELFFNGKSEQLIAQLANQPPLGRLGQPQDIAGVVCFLASEQSGWINGQVLCANGGVA
ncbi:3-ketoacyl-ACP reductase [Erwinia sp. OLTSP20]|uniref:SDR family oxidoreductase n=1 Tax=unclassified Erwinia TaxID=2622719 RepID=UPI000C18632C|nr:MULTISPECIES: SDR family oxidoreductase [unclassified Erwinia]PIJ50759.1 3-ketoacyl-ACP reductase [Erwinia sp. OAMSP11]PIJ75428.1 3-ketoacyl-ACP reductase [Erwinia sp. OLSSP12]PIJ81926.1 3-ketoacyl-ACP reductase [Erwinia sp. OLCASP19]PIJ84581.1 3-ketoacyl-ACP reductase [Erwinia sp. OLMTSP26]PIJ86928.1 3-ketoacyl-ACP reductase [Erwinia sp. OLMDSP33]